MRGTGQAAEALTELQSVETLLYKKKDGQLLRTEVVLWNTHHTHSYFHNYSHTHLHTHPYTHTTHTHAHTDTHTLHHLNVSSRIYRPW